MSVAFWQVFLFHHDYFSLLQNIYQAGWTQSDFLWICFYLHIRKQFKYHNFFLGKMILISENRYAMTSYYPPFCLLNNVLVFCIIFCGLLFVFLSLFVWHYIVCPFMNLYKSSDYPIWYFQAAKNSTDISIVRTTQLLTRRSSWTTISRQPF
jgi:hypothetical protein